MDECLLTDHILHRLHAEHQSDCEIFPLFAGDTRCACKVQICRVFDCIEQIKEGDNLAIGTSDWCTVNLMFGKSLDHHQHQ